MDPHWEKSHYHHEGDPLGRGIHWEKSHYHHEGDPLGKREKKKKKSWRCFTSHCYLEAEVD